MSKVLLALLVVTVQSFPYKKYYCNQIESNVINTDDNEPFMLFSDSYPSTIQKDCTVTILRTPGPSDSRIAFHMMYSFYDAIILQNGTQDFNEGCTYTMRSYTTPAPSPFYVSTLYFPKPATNRWNGFQYFFLPPANRPESSCPMNNNEPMMISEAFVIVIGSLPRDQFLPKLCKWKLKAPAGSMLAVLIQAIWLESDLLMFEGSINGIHTTENFSSNTQGDSIRYFDNELELTLINSKPRLSPPITSLDVTPFRPSAASCSLVYDGQKFTKCSGRFTNMVPFQRYFPNELCRWTVILPKGKAMKVSFLEDDAGDQTGDSLTLITPTGNLTCWKCSSTTEFTITGSNVVDTEVAFEWKTDGVFEYNGFLVDYLIQDCSAINAAPVYRWKWHIVVYVVLACAIRRSQ